MASFATSQRRPHTHSHRIAAPAPAENASRSSAPLPDAAPSLAERSPRGALNPIPLYAAEAPRAEAAFEGTRGIVQERVSMKSAEAGAGGRTPTRAGALPIQRKNVTGLPDTLKAGVETLSGVLLDDVRVHYHSSKAAGLGALAYAQGTEIHVGPGQERHLPHEAWHTVQQKQGRVQPTMQAKGIAVNDDAGLEREADVMGARAAGGVTPGTLVPLARPASPTSGIVQRKIGFEFEMPNILSALATPVTKEEKKKFAEQVEKIGQANAKKKDPGITKDFTDKTDYEDVQRRDYLGTGELVDNTSGKVTGGVTSEEQMGDYRFHALSKKEKVVRGTGFTLEADEGNANADGSGASVTEFVTDAFEEGDAGRVGLEKSLTDFEAATTKIAGFAGKRKVVHANEVAPGGLVGKVIFPSKGTSGVLQVTSAVNLAHIPELMKNMNASEGESNVDKATHRDARDALGSALGGSLAPSGPTGKAPGKAKDAVDDHKNFGAFDGHDPPATLGSDQLQGLVALIASYMMTASSDQLGYAKTIAPIMARTDFARMFRMLSKDEQKYFKENPDALVAIVKFATGDLDMTKDVFPHGIYNDPRSKGAGNKDALKGLTRARWVTGIASGTDYLSAAKFNENPDINPGDRTEKKSDLESMSAMGKKTEKVGSAQKRAPIFEIRSLGQLATPEIMHQRALAIFNFLSALNEDKNTTY
jgi:hypothetical protein